MQYTTILFGLLATAAFGAQVEKPRIKRSEGPDNSQIECGCSYLSDATIEDCQAAIDQIDVTSNDATDPMKALDVIHTGPLSSDSIMFKSGTCSIGASNVQTIQGPKGLGGSVSGTVGSGQTVKDIAQAMLDSCKDTDNGKVNACSSVGAGNLDIGAH